MVQSNIIIAVILAALSSQYPLLCEEQSTNRKNLITNDLIGWVFDCFLYLIAFTLDFFKKRQDIFKASEL
ncbi:unnamed protein product [Adineta ricciae]|uniref:Uncharacterized protein n=1 Tax=Adineta ricciae TaxID=249248 RepID=A0A814WVJ6_ADIRI|nr:unnamed protein product [Adineta ricciae]